MTHVFVLLAKKRDGKSEEFETRRSFPTKDEAKREAETLNGRSADYFYRVKAKAAHAA